MRKTGLKTIEDLALGNDEVVFIGSDLGQGVMDNLKQLKPDQFFMEGISEGHILSMAAGFAIEGYKVYVNTISTFIYKRALEQLAIDICAENLNVSFYGNGGGLVYGPLGHTHISIDDIAILNSLPNIKIFSPADAYEMEILMRASHEIDGPAYFRVAKGGDKIVTSEYDIQISKPLYYSSKTNENLIITTGVMLQRALEAKEVLEKEGVFVSILHYSTLKPFNEEELLKYSHGMKNLIVAEEHLANGGLGSIVSSILFKNKIVCNTTFINLGGQYPDHYGRQEELFELYSLTSEGIIYKIKEMVYG